MQPDYFVQKRCCLVVGRRYVGWQDGKVVDSIGVELAFRTAAGTARVYFPPFVVSVVILILAWKVVS